MRQYDWNQYKSICLKSIYVYWDSANVFRIPMLNKESNIWFNQMCLSNSVHQTQPPGVSFFFVTFCLQELLVLNYFLALSLKSPNNSSLPWQKHNILSLIHFSFFCLTILSNCVKLPSLQLTTSCPSKVFKKLWMKWQNILFFHASCNPNPAGQHIIVHAVQDCYWTLLICIFVLFCFVFVFFMMWQHCD